MATKKITELPLVERVSGSQVAGGSVLPIVIGGGLQATTNRISVENFSKFVTQYSAHTGSVGNTFAGPQTFNSSSTFNDNVTINGKLTVTELVAIYETASVIFSSGSNIFGDKWDDVHTFTGSLIYNNVLVTNIDANTINRLQQATASLQTFTASQADRNLVLSTVTGSINQATASIQFQTASLLQFTASQDSRNFTLSQVTGSFNYFYQATASLQTFTASQADRNLVLSTVTGSINQATASLQTFTASQADRNLVLSTVTGSINQATASLQTFTASQDSRNLTLSTVTGSLIGITNGLMAFTAALDNTYATDAQLYQLYQSTRSLELHSGSMVGVTNGLMAYTASNTSLNTGLRGEVDGIEAYTASLKGQAIVSSSTQVQNYDVFALNSKLYTSTGSLIGITNGLMAFTAALDNTYATDAQLYQLYQTTASLQFQTASLLTFTASQDSRNFTLSQVTGSFRGEIGGLEAYTASLKGAAIVSSSTQVQNYDVFALNSKLYTVTGSLIGITNGLMAFTAALDSTYATDAQLYQLYAETASIKAEIGGIELYTASLKAAAIVSSSTQVQNYDVFALNSNLYNGTGSIKGEIAGIEAYTASLKAAAIVSSSQQITNYYKFAQTASANTFYGTQTITGSVSMTGSLRVGDWIGGSPHVDETARFDVRTTVDRGIKITGNVSSDVIITAYRGASDDLVRGMRLQGSAVDFYIGDGNANTGSYIGGFNTNGLAFAAGKGIDFSATSNGSGTTTSELLNDYETGTWSPQIYYQNGTDQTNSTNVTQVGIYTKVGNVVYASGVLQWTITGSPANDNIGIKNLPFTSKAGADYYNWGLVQLVNAGAYPTDGYVMMMQQNATMMLFYDRRADTSNYGDDIGASGTKTARFSITYLSA